MEGKQRARAIRASQRQMEQHDANGRKDVLMQRMRSVFVKLGVLPVLVMEMGAICPARGDLIRPSISRSYPDIAGDLVGSQTYTFDPNSKTGVFQVVNAPQFIALGPTGKDMLSVTPDKDGTLSQSLQLRLDQNGQMVQTPDNRFQLYGSVVIGDQIYRGLLLEGTPTAFEAQAQGAASSRNANVFDLNVKITGGQLATAFGPEAYFRVVPQSNSTFQGSFASSFSGDKPLTNLRALQGNLPSPIPEPSPLLILLGGGASIAVTRHLRRKLNRGPVKKQAPRGRQQEGGRQQRAAAGTGSTRSVSDSIGLQRS
jgi:hypothetical protein